MTPAGKGDLGCSRNTPQPNLRIRWEPRCNYINQVSSNILNTLILLVPLVPLVLLQTHSEDFSLHQIRAVSQRGKIHIRGWIQKPSFEK